MKLKYNKNRGQFNLIDSGRHYVSKKDRGAEIKQMDKWLMGSDKDVYITFADDKGKLHKDVKVNAKKMQTWFNGNDDYGEWETFLWDFPTSMGHVYIKPYTSRTFLIPNGKKGKDIDKTKVVISMN